MRHYRLLFTGFVLLFSTILAVGQQQLNEVVVTGDVTNIVPCSHDDKAWIYRLVIKLHTKNVSAHTIIISGADAMTDYYKFANTIESLKAEKYAHIGWVNSGSPGDPKTVSDRPLKPFKIVPPNGIVDINVDLRAIVIGELKPGPTYLQVVAENWPDYSHDYISKISQAWISQGILWEHSLHSEPIAFVVPTNLKEVRCP